jgi:hypothetical protein
VVPLGRRTLRLLGRRSALGLVLCADDQDCVSLTRRRPR